MNKPQSVHEVLALWGTLRAAADATKLPYARVCKMQARGSIRSIHWPNFIDAARKLGVDLTADDLLRMHNQAGRRPRPKQTRGEPRGVAA